MSVDAYIGKNTDGTRLLSQLQLILEEAEQLKGAIDAKVGAFNRVVVVTDQRLVHLMPESYEFVDFFYRLSIDTKKRYSDEGIHRLDIEASGYSYNYMSPSAVDILWMDRVLDERPAINDESIEKELLGEKIRRKLPIKVPKKKSTHIQHTGITKGLLATCQVCGGSVSRRADKCPHCGEPGFQGSPSSKDPPSFEERKEVRRVGSPKNGTTSPSPLSARYKDENKRGKSSNSASGLAQMVSLIVFFGLLAMLMKTCSHGSSPDKPTYGFSYRDCLEAYGSAGEKACREYFLE